MNSSIIEASYPITFREETAEELGKHIKNHQSVVLIGMKRVGTNNFLRFFLYHPQIIPTYIDKNSSHLFIHIDLYDLLEKELAMFWALTLQRIVQAIEESNNNQALKKDLQQILQKNYPSQDLLQTRDTVRSILIKIIEAGIFPTIFFNRFDRILSIINPEFFDNLKGLHEACHHKISYVFTSFRTLEDVAPQAFKPASLHAFCHNLYLKPASEEDAKIIFEAEKKSSGIKTTPAQEKKIFELAGGNLRYLHLLLSNHQENLDIAQLLEDEKISFASDELWENLHSSEQEILIKIVQGEKVSEEDKITGKYLWETGFIKEDGDALQIFSPIFVSYIRGKNQNKDTTAEFTEKEKQLFDCLKENLNEVCEREKIAEAVWPEEEDLGVSDWAIDRLIARVRNKIKLQSLPFEIMTVKTRGYKLVPLS